MSPTRASLAAASAAELPLRLNIAFNDESESDSIKNDFLLEQLIRFRVKRIARSSAV